MPAKVYKDMLEVMIKRGGPYSGADIPEFYSLIEALFTPEEARVNNALPRGTATAAAVAKAMGGDEGETRAVLESMADKGLCTTVVQDKKRYYQGAAFMPGIFEYQFLPGRSTDRERKIAFLIQAYKKAYLAANGAPKPGFPRTRVITVDRKISAGNRIHTYDQVATYIDRSETIGVGTCFCRHAAALRGEDTHTAPMDVCMWFGPRAEYAVERLGTRKVTKTEAREVLDRAEKAGLIHMSRNTADEIDFLCNCDRWHCEVVGPILKYSKPGLFFNSGFSPRFDQGKCSGCEICIERCPSGALRMGAEGFPSAGMDRCFGCGVCASGCPTEAVEMEAKPGRPEPPKTLKDLAASVRGAK